MSWFREYASYLVSELRKLKFREISVSRDGFAGAKITFNKTVFCIDVLNTQNCDYALYTHLHPRHFPGYDNVDTSRVVSPSIGFFRVKPGDAISIGNVKIIAVDAYNISETGKEPAHPKGFGVGYIMKFDNAIVYHMGDTDFIPEILNLKTPIHILFIPIGCENVLCPEEALEIVKSLRPSITIPIHYVDKGFLHTFRYIAQPYTQVVVL